MSARNGVRAIAITVGTSPVSIASQLGGSPFAKNIYLRTATGNSGTVAVGGSDISSTNGYLLAADRQLSLLQVFPGSSGDDYDLQQIYVLGSTSGQIIYVLVDSNVTVAD